MPKKIDLSNDRSVMQSQRPETIVEISDPDPESR